MQRVFLDTNIILDLLGERPEHYLAAARVLTLADRKLIQVFTSVTSLTNVYYVLCRHENPKTALEKIKSFKLLCSMSVLNDEVMNKALVSPFKDLEDAVQYYSALATGCDIFLTRNAKDFKHAHLPVMSAEAYLHRLSED